MSRGGVDPAGAAGFSKIGSTKFKEISVRIFTD